jgi:hypothetical protein
MAGERIEGFCPQWLGGLDSEEELSLSDLNDSYSGSSAVVERQSEYLRDSSEGSTEGETVRCILL